MTIEPKETFLVEITNASADKSYNVGETYEVTKASNLLWMVNENKTIYVSDTKIIQKEEQMTATETNENTPEYWSASAQDVAREIQLRQDAERYRWLRDCTKDLDNEVLCAVEFGGEQMDSVIDTAMLRTGS